MICTSVRAYCIRPELRRLCNVSSAVCDAVWAAAYRAVSTAPTNGANSKPATLFQTSRKLHRI